MDANRNSTYQASWNLFIVHSKIGKQFLWYNLVFAHRANIDAENQIWCRGEKKKNGLCNEHCVMPYKRSRTNRVQILDGGLHTEEKTAEKSTVPAHYQITVSINGIGTKFTLLSVHDITY